MTNPAETYEREWVPGLFEPWAIALLAFANARDATRILDVACGSGIVARRASQQRGRHARVTGIDLNPNMIAVARAAADHEQVPVDWRTGSAESLPFADGEFDLVLCQQGLQFVPDRARAVAEMHRVLAGNGHVALALWHGLDRHPLMAEMNDVIHRHLGVPALAIPFSFGEPEAIRSLLENAGFRDVEMESRSMVAQLPDADRYAALQIDVIAAAIPAMQQLDDNARANLLATVTDEMTAIARKAARGNRVAIPMHATLARAKRL